MNNYRRLVLVSCGRHEKKKLYSATIFTEGKTRGNLFIYAKITIEKINTTQKFDRPSNISIRTKVLRNSLSNGVNGSSIVICALSTKARVGELDAPALSSTP